MSNFQWAIVVFLAVIGVSGLTLLLLTGGNQRSPAERKQDDNEQSETVSNPAPLWGGAEQITRRRAGSTGD